MDRRQSSRLAKKPKKDFSEFAEGASDEEKVAAGSGSEAELSDGSEDAPKKTTKRTKSAGKGAAAAKGKGKAAAGKKKGAKKGSDEEESGGSSKSGDGLPAASVLPVSSLFLRLGLSGQEHALNLEWVRVAVAIASNEVLLELTAGDKYMEFEDLMKLLAEYYETAMAVNFEVQFRLILALNSDDSHSSLTRVPAMYMTGKVNQSFLQIVNQQRTGKNFEPVKPLPSQGWKNVPKGFPLCPEDATVKVNGFLPPAKLHQHVCLGGTFDHLHAGHLLMLASAALLAKESIVIGLTGAEMLKNKKFAEALSSFEVREKEVAEYLHLMAPNLKLRISELKDPFGPSIVVPEITALIASPESAEGAKKVNEERLKKGLNALQLYFIPLIKPPPSFSGEEKLSSTAIRQRLLAKKANPLNENQSASLWKNYIV